MRHMSSHVRNAFAVVVSARTWKATAYLLLTLPVGTFWFVVLVTGITTGLSTLMIWVGVPILVATVFAWRAGARAERSLLRTLLDVDIPSPYRPAAETSLWRQLRTAASDPATWKDFVYLALLFPLGILWFSVVTTVWAFALGLLALPLYYWAPDGGAEVIGPYIVVNEWWEAVLGALVGLAAALLVPHVIRAIAHVHGQLARGLLGASRKAELKRRMLELEAIRAKAVGSAEAERRRIERDLHDGAQARLVSLAMELGRAKEKFADDPVAAQALLEHAHEEAKATIAELRNLARGIHPAVLTDRGLDAALSALAARSQVPVRIDVRLRERPPAEVESVAYFVVAEALTNVAKHAEATEVEVLVARDGERLVVEVRDDGVGGARAGANGGIGGLADRVAAVRGTLSVWSPDGGPTIVRAELPCGS
jgi:signal transduction histidine kinase